MRRILAALLALCLLAALAGCARPSVDAEALTLPDKRAMLGDFYQQQTWAELFAPPAP